MTKTLEPIDTLIVYCHPYEMSLGAAVLTAVEAGTLGRMIESVDVFTTSAEPTEHLRAAIEPTLMDGTLAQLGVERRAWHNFVGIDLSTPEDRKAWLAEVERIAAGEDAAC